jgi:hypothetical protein
MGIWLEPTVRRAPAGAASAVPRRPNGEMMAVMRLMGWELRTNE